MFRITVLSFSGTGNTDFVVQALTRELEARGAEVRVVPLESLLDGHPAWPEAELVGIAYPVHAFNAPPLVERALASFPPAPAPRDCFLLRTSGSPWALGGSTGRMRALLAARHYHTRYEALVPMPSNFAVGYPADFIKLNLRYALRQCGVIAGDLLAGREKHHSFTTRTRLLSLAMRVEHIGAHFFGRSLKAGSGCTSCGLCERECPTRNIRLEKGKPRFDWHCSLCMRCSFRCPEQAITHSLAGRRLMLDQPYDLAAILADDSIPALDINSPEPKYLRELREFYQAEGLLGENSPT